MHGGLLVGRRGDNQLDELLAAPALTHEFGGQPVEQLRMRRRLARGPEVIGRADQTDAEKLAPDVIDRDTAGERMLRRDEPFGEIQTVRLLLHGLCHRRQSRKTRGNDIGAAPGVITGHVDIGLAAIFTDLGQRWCFCVRLVLINGVVEEGVEAVVIADRDRIVFVRVALSAADGEAHPHAAGGVHAVGEVLKTRLLLVHTRLGVQRSIAMETAGGELCERRLRQQIPSDLLDGELVKRQVAVDGVDDPVSIAPSIRAQAISEKAVAVGVAGHV